MSEPIKTDQFDPNDPQNLPVEYLEGYIPDEDDISLSAFEHLRSEVLRLTAENARLRDALKKVWAAIVKADPEVLTDTLWLDTECPETAVDHIRAALSPEPQAAADAGEQE